VVVIWVFFIRPISRRCLKVVVIWVFSISPSS
jgi:hypothetical protein